ncbi:hypothetical protein NKG94_06110 [Micromonospora sp. M12]
MIHSGSRKSRCPAAGDTPTSGDPSGSCPACAVGAPNPTQPGPGPTDLLSNPTTPPHPKIRATSAKLLPRRAVTQQFHR